MDTAPATRRSIWVVSTALLLVAGVALLASVAVPGGPALALVAAGTLAAAMSALVALVGWRAERTAAAAARLEERAARERSEAERLRAVAERDAAVAERASLAGERDRLDAELTAGRQALEETRSRLEDQLREREGVLEEERHARQAVAVEADALRVGLDAERDNVRRLETQLHEREQDLDNERGATAEQTRVAETSAARARELEDALDEERRGREEQTRATEEQTRAAETSAARARELEDALEEERRSREHQTRATEEQTRATEEQTRAREAAERRAADLEETLESVRREKASLEKSRRWEQQWIAELRQQIFQLQHERGVLGDPRDVPALVLRIAMSLLGAGKGLLLSRDDVDHDGHLELLASEGFQHDPHDSAVADRFARAVLERDEVIRENDRGDVEAASRTPADEEIENLLAIPIYMLDRFSGVVVCANRQGGFGEYEQEVLLALGGHTAALLQNARLQSQLRGAYVATVRVLADAMEAKDGSLRGHGDEVARYASAVADRLGLGPKQREEVVFGSLLHDVGKIGISERILLKPASLTPEEYGIVKLHPRIGHGLLRQVPALAPISQGILHHHERFDGTGYPSGLKGQEIPREARIICVADSFSAMTASRPYRAPMSYEEACNELRRFAGSQFDPEIVDIFVDEVLRHPPEDALAGLAVAFDDPELAVRRRGDEPLLGHGSFALTDSLTMLYTHRHFHDALVSEARRASVQGAPFSLIMVELDGLAALNEREGFAAGDAALQRAARVVERVAAGCAGTAYRYSGRRLAIIAPHLDAGTGRQLAAEVAREVEGDSVRVHTAVSTSRGDDDDAQSVLARARAELAGVATG